MVASTFSRPRTSRTPQAIYVTPTPQMQAVEAGPTRSGLDGQARGTKGRLQQRLTSESRPIGRSQVASRWLRAGSRCQALSRHIEGRPSPRTGGLRAAADRRLAYGGGQ